MFADEVQKLSNALTNNRNAYPYPFDTSFSFSDNYYKQINEVAMGTKMGPSYANLFVGFIEQQFFHKFDGTKPELYRATSMIALAQFLVADKSLNISSNRLSSKYTWPVSECPIAFLDINVSISGNGLSTSVHYKPTDLHCYLLHSSSHPAHFKNSIPYSQFLRLRRLCSSDTEKCASSSRHAVIPIQLFTTANTAHSQ